MSVLAWLDFDQAERNRMQNLLALFQEQETRDELGLGSIRDFISDQLFPGTSTIQTRLRYMLFVPWVLRSFEGRNGTQQQLTEQARSAELQLIDALEAGGETSGVIGSLARTKLQRLPSSTYWAGLGHWGIRKFEGSIDAYFAALPLLRKNNVPATDDGDGAKKAQLWQSPMPEAPPGFLESCTFALSTDEAAFIKDRLLSSHPQSLLTWLATRGGKEEVSAIWQHPALAHFSPEVRKLVDHAKMVSEVFHGAALLYNLMLSELTKHEPRIAGYRADLRLWAANVDGTEVQAWQPADLFTLMEQAGGKVHPNLRSFVLVWKQLAEQAPHAIAGSAPARALIEAREKCLKKGQSRFTNIARLRAWSGASGTRPLSFRWPQAQTHLKDLAHAG